MKRVVKIGNIPAPYMVNFYYYLQHHWPDTEFSVIYTSRSEGNRQWTIPEEKLGNSVILDAKVIRVRGKLDSRFIHLPVNIGRELSRIKPHCVIALEYNPAALQALVWCKLHGCPFVHQTDGTLHSEREIGRVQTLSRKWIIGQADAAIASSTKAKEKLLAYGMEESRIFTSLLTPEGEQYQGLERAPEPGRLLYVGSMVKRKGLDLLLAALAHCSQPWRLRLVGNGTPEEIAALKAQAESLGIGDKIDWLGFLEGKPLLDEYARAWAFVLPTREDCFGLVLVEALLAGVPILASRYADGAYDVVQEGVNGLLADPYDPKAFGAAVDRMLADREMQRASLESLQEKFSFPQTAKGYYQAVELALRKGKG